MNENLVSLLEQNKHIPALKELFEEKEGYRFWPGQRGHQGERPYYRRHFEKRLNDFDSPVRIYSIDLYEFDWMDISQGQRKDLLYSWQPAVRLYTRGGILLLIELTGYDFSSKHTVEEVQDSFRRLHHDVEMIYEKLGCVPIAEIE